MGGGSVVATDVLSPAATQAGPRTTHRGGRHDVQPPSLRRRPGRAAQPRPDRRGQVSPAGPRRPRRPFRPRWRRWRHRAVRALVRAAPQGPGTPAPRPRPLRHPTARAGWPARALPGTWPFSQAGDVTHVAETEPEGRPARCQGVGVAAPEHYKFWARSYGTCLEGHSPSRGPGGQRMELLERDSFLRTLAEYAGEARQGDGRLVLVSGESGIGKTVLLEAFQRRLTGARWLWGACDGLLTPRPLGPVFDIGSQLGGELADLCHRGAERDRLFAAFLAELDTSAAFTVAVVEDVHWADEATIDLLSFLGRRLGRMKALLLVTYRDDELGGDHPLRMVLGDLATQRATRRMKLPPLSKDAVRALVGQRDVDAAELFRVTGGNPFYVSEIIDAGWPSVPATVRDAVGARLARSGNGTREMVEAAAVVGARVDRSLLSSVLGGPGSRVDECLETGILVPDGTNVRFRHELVRMAVEAAIAPHRKLELHARLLAELERRGDGDPALLAHHADGAGDRQAVLRHAPEAARRSSALGAHREAAAQFERALRFAGDLDVPAMAALHEGAAGEYSLLDRWEEAERALSSALRIRRELGDHLNVGEDLRLLSTTLWRLCRGEESD